MRFSPLIAVFAALLLAACASPADRYLLTNQSLGSAQGAVSARHQIFVTTTRAQSKEKLEVFNGERAAETAYARIDVSVPAIHKTGQIERRKGKVADPGRYFTATDVAVYSRASYEKELRAEIARNGGRAVVFVHGYNTSFDSAVYRVTQIVHDSGYGGVPILFTWASRGRVIDYVYDNNSATEARDSLEDTLRMIAAAGAKRIDIFGHSMGTWVTMEALRQLAIGGDADLGGRLGDVILASPDIDIDVFKAQMRRYGKPKKPFVLMLSADDRALRLSGLIAGAAPRVGDYSDAAELASLGVVVIDLSQISGDRLNHTKFAENPVLIKLIGDGLNNRFTSGESERDLTDRVGQLTRNFGSTLGSAAEIVITTPVSVLKVVVGQ